MAEYILYHGEQIKLGSCETLYNVSYDKYVAFAKEQHWAWNIENVAMYLRIDYGFQFRFPFPDEDKLKFGEINGAFDRTLNIVLDSSAHKKILGDSDIERPLCIGVSMQKPVFRRSDGQFCLALIFKDLQTGEIARIEDTRAVKLIASQIVKHHIFNETDPDKRNFYRQVACRILKGYRAGQVLIQKQDIQQKTYGLLHSETENKNNQENTENQKNKIINKTEDNSSERSRKKGRKMGR